jgi:hypothetical protein
VRELISVVSFVMAVIGGLATMFYKDRDKQTMGSIVAGAFLIPFFRNVKDMTSRKTLTLWILTVVSFTLCFPYL